MNEMQRKEFGDYLRSLRTGTGLTQRAAADRAGVSGPYLAQIERGQRNPPSREILSRLAETYGVEEGKLFHSAGYSRSGIQEVGKKLSTERLEWAFRTACTDSDFVLGTRINGMASPEVKAFVIEMYLRKTKRIRFTAEELEELKEIFNID